MKRITFEIGQGLTGAGEPMRSVEAKRKLAYVKIAKAFGGFTANLGTGGWIDPKDSALVLEPCLTITCFSSDEKAHSAQILGRELQELFEQDSVLIAVEPCDSVILTEPLYSMSRDSAWDSAWDVAHAASSWRLAPEAERALKERYGSDLAS